MLFKSHQSSYVMIKTWCCVAVRLDYITKILQCRQKLRPPKLMYLKCSPWREERIPPTAQFANAIEMTAVRRTSFEGIWYNAHVISRPYHFRGRNDYQWIRGPPTNVHLQKIEWWFGFNPWFEWCRFGWYIRIYVEWFSLYLCHSTPFWETTVTPPKQYIGCTKSVSGYSNRPNLYYMCWRIPATTWIR